MKKLIPTLLTAATLSLPLTAFAVQTIDAPHLDMDGFGYTEDCSYCHFDFTMAVTDAKSCESCHNSSPEPDGVALAVTTHQGMKCETCHNPHVSLQYQGDGTNAMVIATGLVATESGNGTITFDNGDNGLTPISTTYRDSSFSDASSWAAKTSNSAATQDSSRGLTLWATGGGTDNYSYEVIAATDNQIVVRGSLPSNDVLGSDIELHYGQLISKKITPHTNYRYGANNVNFSGPSTFVEADTTTPAGICQVCHDPASPTAPRYWLSDGSELEVNKNHNVNKPCTRCHVHNPADLTKDGFSAEGGPCNSCHQWPPSTGIHELHASKYTCDTTGELFPDDLAQCNILCGEDGGTCVDNGNYGFSCTSCHKGGMESWHNPLMNDTLEIGFSNLDTRFNGLNFSGVLTEYDGSATPAYPYNGVNETDITAVNNDMTCSGIYCHSNGLAVRETCLAGDTSDYPSNPPSWADANWDPQDDSYKCNNCHHDSFTDNDSDTHWGHLVKPGTLGLPNLKCAHCHYGTATIDAGLNNAIADKQLHVNGQYDLLASGSNIQWNGVNVGFSYFEASPGTYGCSSIPCHNAREWKLKQDTCTVDSSNASTYAPPNVDPVAEATCEALDSNSLLISLVNSVDQDYMDPLKNAAFGGGHNGSPGLLKIYYLNMVNTDMEDYHYVPLADSPSAPYSFTHYWKTEDFYVDPADGRPYAYFEVKLADNSPGSVDNLFANTPGGWDVDDGNVPSLAGWRRCVMDTPPSPTVNDLVQPDWSVARLDAHTIQITDRSVDPDYNDASKGHNGATNAYILAFYFTDDETPGGTPGGGANGGGSYHLSDVAVDQVLPSFTFDDGDLDYDSRPGERLAWYVLEYYDNHYIDIDSTTPITRTGWQYFNITP